VKLFFKNILSGSVGCLCAVNLFVGCVFFKNRSTGKPEQLRFWEKFLDGFMVFTKLRPVAFVKNKNQAFIL
jgi:hypothetical protein